MEGNLKKEQQRKRNSSAKQKALISFKDTLQKIMEEQNEVSELSD